MVTDLSTFLLDNDNTIFRFLVYKKVFTPQEVEKKWLDQSIFESNSYNYGIIMEAVELPNKDTLLGIRLMYDDEFPEEYSLEYYLLSEIKLHKFEEDNNV